MTTRVKPLLAMYGANRGAINKIATARLDESGEYDQMCKQLSGPEFVRKWRTTEMRIVPDQKTAWLIGHHILCAQQEILQPTVTLLNEPFRKKAQPEPYPRSDRCKIIRELPEALLNRLQPVFSQTALFDPAQDFKKQFDAWQKSLVSQLDEAERGIVKGKGYQTRRYAAYREIFDAVLPQIEAWFDAMVALLAEAGYVDHRMPNDTSGH